METDQKKKRKKHILKRKFAIATIHDISPKYTDKVFQLSDELEKLNIKFNFAVIPWYNKQQEYDKRKILNL